MRRASLLLSIALLCLVASACQHTTDVIPDRLEGRVDHDLRYADIKDHPETYRGKLMLVGGKVLSAKRTQQGTELEVLQIPLSEELVPTGSDTETKGRFVIIDRNNDKVSDPAAFDDEKKRVTVVGEVLGTTTVRIDDVQQQVPELAVKNITIWDWDRRNSRYGPYYSYAYRYGYPYFW
ncbi:MAG TPA: Slp family lipoprotein [Nitrospira sp.]|nr:Slp family lipoprotein [Nitrospira sp.]